MAEALRTGTPIDGLEAVVERPDGDRVSCLVNIALLRNASGKIIGAVNCLQDISESKRAAGKVRESQELLTASELRFRSLFEHAAVGPFDLYVYKAGTLAKSSDGKTGANDELQAQIRDLSEKVNGFQTAAQQSAAASAQAQVMARFNARVDDLFGQLPADKVPLTSYEKRIITGALKDELTSDQNVVKRIYNGNFVDVPRQFKTIVEGLVKDRVAAADTAKAARERSSNRAQPDFGAGPVDLPKDFYDVSDVPLDKLWDDDSFVNALTKT